MGSNKTAWHPLVERHRNHRFVMSDKSIVETPMMEESSGRRRIRVHGTQKSHPRGHVLDAQLEWVKQQALPGVTPTFRLPDNRDAMLADHKERALPRFRKFEFDEPSVFHKMQPVDPTLPSYRRPKEQTDVVWEFQSVDFPDVSAFLWLSVTNTGVDMMLTYPSMHSDASGRTSGVSYYTDHWNGTHAHVTRSPNSNLALIPKIPVNARPRDLFAIALREIKALDAIDRIEIPFSPTHDSPTDDNVEWLPFTFVGSTVNQQLIDDLHMYATGDQIIDRIRENYLAIRRDLGAIGLSVTEAEKDPFLRSVDERSSLSLTCHMVPDNPIQSRYGDFSVMQVDDRHTVSLDLQTGSLLVNCTGRDTDSEITEKWEFARFEAELRGELDEFLGYARRGNHTRAKRRLDTAIDLRK